MGFLDVHAINYKDGWRQSIYDGCFGEFQVFLWCEFIHFPFLFDAHVGNYPCIDQITHKRDGFVCDYVATIKICQGQLYTHYSNPTMKNTSNVFKEFHDLIDYIHNIVHLKLKASSLHLNTLGVQYLWFDFVGYKFKCPCVKDASASGDLQWSCGCCKGMLFRFLLSTHFWVYLTLCLSE